MSNVSCWFTYAHPFFSDLVITSDADRMRVSALIRAASEFIEKYCGRTFLKSELDEQYKVQQDGTIILNSPPVERVIRLCSVGSEVLQFTHPTATNVSVSTSATAIYLNAWVNGVRTETILPFATHTTLNAIVVATPSPWVCSLVGADSGSLCSSDIMSQQMGKTKLDIWKDVDGWYNADVDTGIVHTNIPFELGFYPWSYYASTLPRWTKVRVVYVGGFTQVPDPILLVCSKLVKQFYDNDQVKSSESLGSYSYSIFSPEDLLVTDRKILALYRVRRVV
jgi:hypothetical protein